MYAMEGGGVPVWVAKDTAICTLVTELYLMLQRSWQWVVASTSSLIVGCI
jgi:hypothetical protein